MPLAKAFLNNDCCIVNAATLPMFTWLVADATVVTVVTVVTVETAPVTAFTSTDKRLEPPPVTIESGFNSLISDFNQKDVLDISLKLSSVAGLMVDPDTFFSCTCSAYDIF